MSARAGELCLSSACECLAEDFGGWLVCWSAFDVEPPPEPFPDRLKGDNLRSGDGCRLRWKLLLEMVEWLVVGLPPPPVL